MGRGRSLEGLLRRCLYRDLCNIQSFSSGLIDVNVKVFWWPGNRVQLDDSHVTMTLTIVVFSMIIDWIGISSLFGYWLVNISSANGSNKATGVLQDDVLLLSLLFVFLLSLFQIEIIKIKETGNYQSNQSPYLLFVYALLLQNKIGLRSKKMKIFKLTSLRHEGKVADGPIMVCRRCWSAGCRDGWGMVSLLPVL